MTDTVIEVHDLEKYFVVEQPFYKQLLNPFAAREKICALRAVGFGIETGEILGVVGPNGAGKTTLLRILADLLQADAGSVALCGQRLTSGNFHLRSKIGYVPSDERSFFWRITGRENLEFFGRLYGLSCRQAKTRSAKLIEEFSFEKKADQLFRDYSAGMRKKVSVMRAMLHRPSILLLDEVTNSLDPGSAKTVKEIVRSYVSAGKDRAAVWSTHRLEEVSQICDKVVMIDVGRIISTFLAEDFSQSSDYMLKVESLNGKIDAFCRKIGFRTKVRLAADKANEILISGIDSRQFSQVVSMAVRDFDAYVIFAGRIKKDLDEIFEDLQFTERLYGCDC